MKFIIENLIMFAPVYLFLGLFIYKYTHKKLNKLDKPKKVI
jgi:hypothetical protein